MSGLARGTAAALLAWVTLAVGAAGVASAQPGVLDGSFGSGGVVTTSTTQLLGVAVQSNGDVVAAGQSGGNIVVDRYTTTGAAAGSYTGPAGVARSVAIAPDGSIFIAGASGGAMFVEKLTSSLAPDQSFGSHGIASAFGGQGGVANAVAVSPGGGVVAAGYVGNAPSTGAVAEFGSTGSATGQLFGFGGNSLFEGVAVEPSGNIVIVGRRNPSQAVDALIALLGPGGNQLSVATYNYPGAGSTAFGGVALQNNGLIVVGGQANLGNGPQAIFARYNGTSLDPGFGDSSTPGVTALPASESLNINPGNPIGAYGVGVAGGGAVIGTGPFSFGALQTYSALWAVNSSGSAESGFGNGSVGPGVSIGPPTSGSGSDEGCAIAIAPDGSSDAGEIVVAGDVPSSPDTNPCSSSSSGFVASYGGYGPPPPPISGAAPSVITGAATSVTPTSATVAGSVNPNGLTTTYQFQYGTTTMYDSSTPSAGAGSGTSAAAKSAALASLLPGTIYHYRLVATNLDGTGFGADETFTTPPAPGMTGPPSASTGGTSHKGEVSVTLGGSVTANGLSTTYSFQYGKRSSYGSRSSSKTVSGTAAKHVTLTIKGLKPGTTYHYRITAKNADGSVHGLDRTFKTAPRLSSKLHNVPSSVKRASLLSHGLTIQVTCSQACTVSGGLIISAATAQQLGLGKRAVTVASGSGSAKGGKLATLTLLVKKTDQAALSKQSGLTLTLRTVSRPRGGGPAVVNTKSISLTG